MRRRVGGFHGRFCRRGAGAFLDGAKQRTDGDGIAIFDGNVSEHTGGRRRHFDRDFIGLKLDQRFVNGDSIAGLLEPLADGCFGHRLAERWHANLSHGLCLLVRRLGMTMRNYPSASSRKFLSWSWCSDICPTAVDAAAGRPV